jgi:hypothetical protein
MGLEFTLATPTISLDDLGAVQSNSLERIDGDEDNPAVSIYAMLRVSVSDGMEHWKKILVTT